MEKQKKKIILPSELVYVLSIVIIAFAVSILTTANFGISMIVAPAYILSEKISFLTFGQSEYVIQAIIFIILCIIVRKIKPIFFVSFLTCLIYGLVLDLVRLIPIFNPTVCPPESLDLWVRIVFFVVGMVLTSIAVALSFKTYIYPQVYDFFVKEVPKRLKIKFSLFKTIFDISMLLVGTILTLILFKGFVGISWGTLIMAVVNGSIIGFFSKTYDKYFISKPLLPKFARLFEI